MVSIAIQMGNKIDATIQQQSMVHDCFLYKSINFWISLPVHCRFYSPRRKCAVELSPLTEV